MLNEKIGLRENTGEIDVVNQQWALGKATGYEFQSPDGNTVVRSTLL